MSSGYTLDMQKKTKNTTMRFTPQDMAAIARIRELYSCISDTAAVRLALQIVARQEQSPTAPLQKGTAFHPLLERPDSYPQITNGGEKRDERPQARFANGAILSKGFSSQESHRCDEQGSHPSELSPSKTSPESCGKSLGQSMQPRQPEAQAQ